MLRFVYINVIPKPYHKDDPLYAEEFGKRSAPMVGHNRADNKGHVEMYEECRQTMSIFA